MPWGIDEIELVTLTVCRVVEQRNALSLDRDTALALERHGVEHLVLHLTGLEPSAELDEAVSQRRLTMVDVRDYREITDVLHRFRGDPRGDTRASKSAELYRLAVPALMELRH